MPSLPTHGPMYTLRISSDSVPTTGIGGKATLVHCVIPGESGEGGGLCLGEEDWREAGSEELQ